MLTLESKSQKGFTLFEVLIAIVILSLIMLAIFSITSGSQEKVDDIVEKDQVRLTLETALNRLEWDFSHIYSPLYFSQPMQPKYLNDREGEAYNRLVDTYSSHPRFAFPSYEAYPVPRIDFDRDGEIRFLSLANRRKFKNSKQSRFAWIQYTLESLADYPPLFENESYKEGSKVLVRKMINENVHERAALDWDATKGQVLLRNIESIKFEFWNPQTRKWVSEPRSVPDGEFKLFAIKITLEWIDPYDITTVVEKIIRPLFPIVKLEDYYKYLAPQTSTTSGTSTSNGSTSSGGTTQ